MKSNKGFTMVEVMVSMTLITIITLSLTSINNNILKMYEMGIKQMAEIRELETCAEGIYTYGNASNVGREIDRDLDNVLKLDASNTTYSTYLEPGDKYTYTGSGFYMRYGVEKYETRAEKAISIPYYLEMFEHD